MAGPSFGACQRSREFSSDLRCSNKVSAYGFRLSMLYISLPALPTRWFLEVFRVVVDAARWNMVG